MGPLTRRLMIWGGADHAPRAGLAGSRNHRMEKRSQHGVGANVRRSGLGGPEPATKRTPQP